jgi:hypothetical protein
VDERRRQGELADVLEEQAGAELLQRVLRQQPATHEQPDDRGLDRMLDVVLVRRRAVRVQGAVADCEDLVHDLTRHIGEVCEDLGRQQSARHHCCLLECAVECCARVMARI